MMVVCEKNKILKKLIIFHIFIFVLNFSCHGCHVLKKSGLGGWNGGFFKVQFFYPEGVWGTENFFKVKKSGRAAELVTFLDIFLVGTMFI